MCAILGKRWNYKPKARKRLRQLIHLCTVMDVKLIKKQKTMSEIKHSGTTDGTGNMLLTASILFANIDYSSLMDYAIKAFVGGAIWMAFKIGGEYFSDKIKRK